MCVLFTADTLKDRKRELGILNPKKAYNICKYARFYILFRKCTFVKN